MARIRDESDPVMARTERLLGPVAARIGNDVIVWLAPGDDTFLRLAHPLRGTQRTGDTQRVGTRGTPDTSIAPDLRTHRTCERPGPANASPEPRRSHPEAQTTPKLIHPRPRDLHPQSGPRRSDPPCSRPNLAAPTPGAHIPSHNTSTPTQKETLCSQLSTSA